MFAFGDWCVFCLFIFHLAFAVCVAFLFFRFCCSHRANCFCFVFFCFCFVLLFCCFAVLLFCCFVLLCFAFASLRTAPQKQTKSEERAKSKLKSLEVRFAAETRAPKRVENAPKPAQLAATEIKATPQQRLIKTHCFSAARGEIGGQIVAAAAANCSKATFVCALI